MNKYCKRALRIILATVLIVVCLAQSALAASTACLINAKTKVYETASTSARTLTVAKNTAVTLTATRGNWAQVKRGTAVAYIPVQYLTLRGSLTVYAAQATRLYRSASTSRMLATVPKGRRLVVTRRSGSYFYGTDKTTGKTGYIPVSAVSTYKPSTTTVAATTPATTGGNSSKIETLISIARSMLGRPYSHSAEPPKSFDCSRFTAYCYKQIGVSITSSAAAQGYLTKYQRITSKSALKRGDILVFNTNETDSDLSDHVAIYLGSGQFIHASSSAGKVIISTFTNYYTRVFSWGLRILP